MKNTPLSSRPPREGKNRKMEITVQKSERNGPLPALGETKIMMKDVRNFGDVLENIGTGSQLPVSYWLLVLLCQSM